MKLILSSYDFLNPNSKQIILENIDMKIEQCKVLFIPNEKANYNTINSNKYYKRLEIDGFINKENIYIFDETKPQNFKNLDIDLIYIGGGNTFATMNKLKQTNFLEEIRNYIKSGVTYIGGSCGAHIVSKNIKHVEYFDDNLVGLTDYNGLGLIDGIIIPHYDLSRQIIYNTLKKEKTFDIYTLTNDDSIIVTDNDVKVIKGN